MLFKAKFYTVWSQHYSLSLSTSQGSYPFPYQGNFQRTYTRSHLGTKLISDNVCIAAPCTYLYHLKLTCTNTSSYVKPHQLCFTIIIFMEGEGELMQASLQGGVKAFNMLTFASLHIVGCIQPSFFLYMLSMHMVGFQMSYIIQCWEWINISSWLKVVLQEDDDQKFTITKHHSVY